MAPQGVYGYLRDPLDKGLPFEHNLLPKLTPQNNLSVDLRSFCTPSHQGRLNSCAGNCTADAIEILSAIEGHPFQASRMFVYNLARTLHGEIDKDRGTYISSCFEVLSRFGICREDIWPYDETKVFTSPSIVALQEATGHRLHSYYRIVSEGYERVDNVKKALRALHPVCFGTQINDSFLHLKTANPVTVPTGPIVGAHAMILVGWLEDPQLFVVKNSWGTDWGDQGFCYFTEDYVAWENSWDFWVPTMGTMF